MSQTRLFFPSLYIVKNQQYMYKRMSKSHDYCIFFPLIIAFIFENDFIVSIIQFSTATLCIYIFTVNVFLCITRDTSVDSYGWPRHISIRYEDYSVWRHPNEVFHFRRFSQWIINVYIPLQFLPCYNLQIYFNEKI